METLYNLFVQWSEEALAFPWLLTTMHYLAEHGLLAPVLVALLFFLIATSSVLTILMSTLISKKMERT